MTTRIIPTDKSGNIYRGPKTWAAVVEIVGSIESQAHGHDDCRRDLESLAEQLADHGYTGLSGRLRREYGLA